MNDVIVAGVGGAVLGAAVTVAGTLAVSVFLDRQRENRRLLAALEVVSSELEDNALRIDLGRARNHLTLGDWKTNKAALAGLTLRNDRLWTALLGIYGSIYEAVNHNRDPPTADQLRTIRRDLIKEMKGVRKDIWALPKSARRTTRSADPHAG